MKASNKQLILKVTGIIAAALLAVSCVQEPANNFPFSGVWKQTDENMISSEKSEREIRVICDGKRYRIESDSRNVEYSVHSIEIFDGQSLHTKSEITEGMAPPENGSFRKTSITEAEAKKTRDEWYNNPIPNFKKGPGGIVAGTETIFYEGVESRPDSEIRIQVWIDPKSGLVLKSVLQIYSKQVEQLIARTTKECLSLQTGTVSESAFIP